MTEERLATTTRFGLGIEVAYLINRNPSGRLLCLHGLLQYVSHHWGDGPYEIKHLKFDASRSPNIHAFSPCLSMEYGFETCIYLDNPSSLAGCGLVNSVVEDTQKSKSASDIFNALDGLGFITRTGNTAQITSLGKRFIEADRSNDEWELIAREGVQNYGPFAGLVFLASTFEKANRWTRSDISLGFAETGETVPYEGGLVTLSTGSQNDTITRSRSSLIAWGVATGFFLTSKPTHNKRSRPSQVDNYDYLMASKWADGFWNSELVYQKNDKIVERPLSYNQLVKSLKSLRENGQEAQRNASIQWEVVVKNRRLAIAYALHRSAEIKKPLVFEEFAQSLSELSDFTIDKANARQALASELANAFVIGTPYTLQAGNLLLGSRRVNLGVLTAGASADVIRALEKLLDKETMFAG